MKTFSQSFYQISQSYRNEWPLRFSDVVFLVCKLQLCGEGKADAIARYKQGRSLNQRINHNSR